jgi:hypothetical protein
MLVVLVEEEQKSLITEAKAEAQELLGKVLLVVLVGIRISAEAEEVQAGLEKTLLIAILMEALVFNIL